MPPPPAKSKLNPSERMDRVPPGLGVMGMWLFLASLAMLFLSTLAGYIYVRVTNEVWKSAQLPDFPATLWLSTFVIILSSLTHQKAQYAIKADQPVQLLRYMTATLILALVFLGLQILSWLEFIRMHLPNTQRNLYTFTFYMLTVLHALHVLGGLVPLSVVTYRAFHNKYTRYRYEGVTHSLMYWHFLGVVWMVLFITLICA